MDLRKALVRGLILAAVTQILTAGILLWAGAPLQDTWFALAAGVPAFVAVFVLTLLFDAAFPKPRQF